jgi:Ca2+-binding EF-hand superfamily protein
LNDVEEVKKAFKILDNDHDGKISVQDFNDIFCSYGGARMNSEIWSELLKEADRGGDGFISENEFTDAMHMVMRNSLKVVKKRDQRMRHTVKPPEDA